MKLSHLTLRVTLRVFLGAALYLIATLPALAQGKRQMSGELGVDLRNFSYKSEIDVLDGSAQNFDVKRTLSTHFLDLTLSGPVANTHFANYSLNARVFGAYFRTNASESNFDNYESPDLRNYGGQLTLFPARRYPLKLYHNKTRVYSLRYEPSSRSSTELLLPELAVVRRYQADQTTTGAQFKYAFNESTSFTASLKKDNSKNLRSYDFNEDRNIWVVTSTIVENPLEPYDTVIISNTILDADFIVVVDDVVKDTALAGVEITLAIDSGYHDIILVPTRYYNQFSFRIEMRGDMIWRIVFNPPLISDKREQDLESVVADFRYDGDGKFTNNLHMEANAQDESIQNLLTSLTNISNTARYELSPNVTVEALSNYNKIVTDLVNISKQTASSIQNTASLRWAPSRGPSANLTHMFSRNSSATEVSGSSTNVVSKLHTLNSAVRMPSRWHKHRFTIKGAMSVLRDNQENGNDLYSATVINKLELYLFRVKLEPRHDLKYAVSRNLEPPDPSDPGGGNVKTTTEIEPKFALAGKVPTSEMFGDISFRLGYDYRKRSDDVGLNIKARYYGDVTIIREFSKKLKMTFSTSRVLETFGGSTPTAGPNPTQKAPAKPNERQAFYKLDAQISPSDDVYLGVGVALITQDGSKIRKLNLNINLLIPWINLPVRSFLVTDTREIDGLPTTQSSTSAETKISYQFRQITLIFAHSYTREKLISQVFTVNEVRAELNRNFSVF